MPHNNPDSTTNHHTAYRNHQRGVIVLLGSLPLAPRLVVQRVDEVLLPVAVRALLGCGFQVWFDFDHSSASGLPRRHPIARCQIGSTQHNTNRQAGMECTKEGRTSSWAPKPKAAGLLMPAPPPAPAPPLLMLLARFNPRDSLIPVPVLFVGWRGWIGTRTSFASDQW